MLLLRAFVWTSSSATLSLSPTCMFKAQSKITISNRELKNSKETQRNMYVLKESGVVDAATHFEQRRGRRAFAEKNASQISFGDPSYDPFKENARAAKPAANSTLKSTTYASYESSTCGPGNVESRPMRRPRGPGNDFARYIEANGFPTDASRRSARVDITQETLYHYQPDGLHTHRKLTRMPFRSKQCDDNLQLFLRPEEALARAEAQRRRCAIAPATDASIMQSNNLPTSCAPPRTDSSFHLSRGVGRHDLNTIADGVGYDSSVLSDEHGGKKQSLDLSAPLQHRLRLLEELYAREYSRLHEANAEFAGELPEEEVEDEGVVFDPRCLLPEHSTNVLPDEPASNAHDFHASQRRRRCRFENGLRDLGDERYLESGLVSPKAESRQRTVQPWEREYGHAEALENGHSPMTGSDSLSDAVSSKQYRFSERAEDGGTNGVRHHNDPLAYEGFPVDIAQKAVRREEQLVLRNAMERDTAESSGISNRVQTTQVLQGRQQYRDRPNTTERQDRMRTQSPTLLSSQQATQYETDYLWKKQRPHSRTKAQPKSQASVDAPSQTWIISPSQRAPEALPSRLSCKQGNSSPQKISLPPRLPKKHLEERSTETVYYEKRPSTQSVFTPVTRAVAPQPPSPFSVSTTKSLRDVCAEWKTQTFPNAAEEKIKVLSTSTQMPAAGIPKTAPQTLRDVYRALQTSLVDI